MNGLLKRLVHAGLGVALMTGVVGTATADFRATRMGARPRSMGSAFVALADDACATHWNPAGLVNEHRFQAMVTRNWMYDIADVLQNDALTLDLPGFAVPGLGKVHTGFGFVRLGLRDIYYEDTYIISAAADASFLQGLSLGVTGKVYRLRAPGYEQWGDPSFLGDDTGYAADLGALFDSGRGWTLGAALYNLNEPYLQLISTTVVSDPVYQAFAVGGSYLFRDTLLVTADLRSREGGWDDTTINGGTEIWFYDALALRAGMFEGHVTMGVGFQDDRWRLDLALETHKELGDVYLLSFTLRN